MKRIIYTLIVGCCWGLMSCSDFLDQVPKYNQILENSVTDYNGAKNILNGMYTVIQSEGYPYYARNLGGNTFGKLSAQGGFYNLSDFASKYNMAYKEGTEDEEEIWLTYYRLVNAANAAIEGIGNLDVAKFPSPEEKEALLAEARCMRAWAYTNLLWLYNRWWDNDDSPYGLIYRDKMSNLSNLQVKRSTVGDSYKYIFEDLDAAIKNMPDFTSSRYLSKQLAQVLKAKILLYRGAMRGSTQDLKDALELVIQVKTTAPAGWEMESDLVKMYEDGWDSKEVLWTRYLGDLAVTGSQVEHFYSYTIGYDNTYHDIPDAWLKEDPRYELVMDSVRAPETWDTKKVFAPIKLYHKGQYDEPKGKYTSYYFRYAELYLMEAELKARLDEYSVADALAPLNEMRAKRTNPKLPPLSASSKKELLRKIFQEIWVEQFLENGSEYFAALRFINDTDPSVAQNKPWIYTLKEDINFTEDQYCWPIPEKERISNFLAEQNPGLNK